MNNLIRIDNLEAIPVNYTDTPIGLLLEYHNLVKEPGLYEKAELLIGMCMDNRKQIRIPENFAFILRAGGANLRYSEFKVSYAIAVGRVSHIALIGHDNCGMVNLAARKELFISGLIENAGWDRTSAEEHFLHYEPMFEIGSETEFILSEVRRLRLRYPKVTVAPMMYMLEDGLLYLIEE